ncbi:hypothetical protein [uncultured Microbacterium sp.]|uniref:hypothetical protein n=1 Tax=uncultured Microbacterium sp. TaxID=191216 RepID=UPI0026003211|nr:hypothetical protein [uncultured Microbacterium sp.]
MLDRLPDSVRYFVIIVLFVPLGTGITTMAGITAAAGGVFGVDWPDAGRSVVDASAVALFGSLSVWVALYLTPLTRRFGPSWKSGGSDTGLLSFAALLPWKGRVRWRGAIVTRRTRAMLQAVEDIVGFQVLIGQGSYNAGGVKASGSTHDREAIDIRIRTYDASGRLVRLTKKQRVALVVALKQVGFACWHRPQSDLWGEHIHALPIGGDLSPAAAAQVIAFDRGRDGLTGNRADATYRVEPPVQWDYRKGAPVPRKAAA